MFPFSLSDISRTFHKNDILSIDIGYTNIKVVHSRKKSNGLIKILNYGIGETPSGCIKNGIISDTEGIVDNLRKVVSDNKMNEKNVKFVISAGSSIISKVIFIQKEDNINLEMKIKENITRYVPVDIRNHKLFYRVLEERKDDSDQNYKVLVTIVPNTTIENYLKIIKLLNFKPVSIEVPFSSVARFFSKGVRVLEKENWYYTEKLVDISGGAIAVVDLGSETTNLSILNKGALEFNRIILNGGRNLDEIIALKLGVKREVAERFKKMHGIVYKKHVGDEIEQVVDSIVRRYMGEILKNIQRSAEFYFERCEGKKIEKIFFIGGGSGLKGLKAFSQEMLGISAYTLDMMELNNIFFEERLDKDKIRFLVNALGLAL